MKLTQVTKAKLPKKQSSILCLPQVFVVINKFNFPPPKVGNETNDLLINKIYAIFSSIDEAINYCRNAPNSNTLTIIEKYGLLLNKDNEVYLID